MSTSLSYSFLDNRSSEAIPQPYGVDGVKLPDLQSHSQVFLLSPWLEINFSSVWPCPGHGNKGGGRQGTEVR